MKPPIPITDPRFKYVDSASTDVAKTFARVRREMAKANVELVEIVDREVVPLRRKA